MVRLVLAAVLGGSGVAIATEQPQLELWPGAVGAAYVTKRAGAETTLTLVFPRDAVKPVDHATKGRPVVVQGELVLFDEKGLVQRLPAKDFLMRFWCENDGGQQVRAEVVVKVKLARPLQPRAELQQLGGFVVVAKKGEAPKLPPVTASPLALMGDLEGDGVPEAGLVTAPDEANNCDGKPANNLTITLHANGRADALRCCGP